MRGFNILFSTIFLVNSTLAQCPWQRDIPDLQTSCLCAYNLGHELSVQCDQVDFPLLIDALDRFTRKTPIDLLYVNNSTIDKLTNHIFINLRLHNLQLSSCKIREIDDNTFDGQELVLKNLNLQDNHLDVVPVNAIKILQILNLLDLSKNHIKQINDNTFFNLKKLTTLKLSDNNVALSTGAFRGIELSLKNLNLKGTRQKRIPECIRGLKKLAFLDLSQNAIQELPGIGGIRTFEGLDSLTALNLERNLIQTLGETAFAGVRKTLSSLSLLNNLLAEFPVGAIHSLKELRVLDIGFNLLTVLPETSFRGNPSVTLLALDGNPLPTVPENAMAHLNRTLRGLSLGGRFLHCDCKLKWVAEWIRNGDLQVTSRERNPQFCGSPTRFHDRGFYSIQPEELTCPESNIDLHGPIGVIESLVPPQSHIVTPKTDDIIPTSSPSAPSSILEQFSATKLITQPSPSPTTTTTTTTTANTTIKLSSILPNITFQPTSTDLPSSSSSTYHSSLLPQSTTDIEIQSTIKPSIKTSSTWKQQHSTQQPHSQSNSPPLKQRPPLVLGFPAGRGSTLHADDTNEVNVKNAFRQDNSVIIQWDSDTVNILGFRVVYRLFADKSFKQGPPLEASEREFKIKNVPAQECLVVCVISLEEINVTPETVPYSQCREVRTNASTHSNLDKITIAASAAVCGTIIVAVIVFIAACRRRSKKIQSLHSSHKNPLPIARLPVNCCVPTGSPGPLGSIATLSAFNHHKDWDQVSAYSGRSIPRPRNYSIDNSNIADDLRSHISHFSAVGGGVGGNSGMGANGSNGAPANEKSGNARSIADGQSQHSFSNHSHRGYLGSAFPTNLVNSRPELRQSRQSLAAASDRMSRASYAASVPHAPSTQSITSNSRRTRPRSRSREQLNGTHVYSHRPGSRYSTTGSQHTLNNYCDTSDNWTDHDMDIYIARNATTRNGLVPL